MFVEEDIALGISTLNNNTQEPNSESGNSADLTDSIDLTDYDSDTPAQSPTCSVQRLPGFTGLRPLNPDQCSPEKLRIRFASPERSIPLTNQRSRFIPRTSFTHSIDIHEGICKMDDNLKGVEKSVGLPYQKKPYLLPNRPCTVDIYGISASAF